MSPIISVIMPTYNRSRVIRRALESVLDQSMEQFELIVVDDGSSDQTIDLLASFDDPRLHVLVQENAGVCVARNAGVAASSANFVTFLDSDDEAGPGWLEFFAGAGEDGFQLASCGMHFVGPGSRYELVVPENLNRAFGNVRARYLAGSYAIEKQLLLSVGAFRPGLRFSENTDLGLRLGGRMLDQPFSTTSTDQPLATAHRDERGYDPLVRYESSMVLLDVDSEHLRRSPKLHADYAAIAGVAASKLGRHAEARGLLTRSVRINPLGLKNYVRLAREVVRRH
jgi:glycosyltransferase involved in cell wall biosynthesis